MDWVNPVRHRPDSGISIAGGHLAVWFQDSQSTIWMAEVR
jgi:hypothetical protein